MSPFFMLSGFISGILFVALGTFGWLTAVGCFDALVRGRSISERVGALFFGGSIIALCAYSIWFLLRILLEDRSTAAGMALFAACVFVLVCKRRR